MWARLLKLAIPWWVYVVAFGAIVTVGTGLYLGHVSALKKSAYAAGVAADKSRSDAVINKLERDALAARLVAETKVQAIEDGWRTIAIGAQRDRDKALSQNRKISAALTAAATERDQLRNEGAARTATVTGGVAASDDSVAACRDRAERTFVSLEAALRTSRECAGDAEDASEGERSLLGSWPVIR